MRRWGPSTDIYALGCVLYECLTGQLPFHRDDDAALLWAHLVEAPPPVSGVRPDLPPAVDDVVARAMAKAPEDRYASCHDARARPRARPRRGGAAPGAHAHRPPGGASHGRASGDAPPATAWCRVARGERVGRTRHRPGGGVRTRRGPAPGCPTRRSRPG